MGAAVKKEVKGKEAPAKKKVKPELKVVATTKKKSDASASASATKKAANAPLTDVSKLTPLQKAQLARKNGTAKPSTKKPLPLFKAPADFKPHFVEVVFRTEADGLLGNAIKCVRYVGRYDPNAEDKKKRDMAVYDWKTMIGVQARFAGVTFKPTNDKKYPVSIDKRAGLKGSMRLPASTSFKVLLRVNRRKADESLSVIVKNVWQAVKNDAGRVTSKELVKDDPVYRMIRRVARLMPAAFKDVQQPPLLREMRKRAAAAE
jgi:hypothetical protein